MSARIRVNLPSDRDRSYDITIRAGVLSRAATHIAARAQGNAVFIITDDTVGTLYGGKLLRGLHHSGADAAMLTFPHGEASKTQATVYALHSQLIELGVRRSSLIVALGGGIVGDIAGYVAATILRGIAFIQIPTTLLAQVDSSVGGKVGIDHPLGKNLIGAFHQPAAVLIDPEVLRTLPESEFRNGLAEMVKIAAALDRAFFGRLERSASSLKRTGAKALTPFIAAAVGLKAAVVMADEREGGVRKALNVGHTLGHALEIEKRFQVPHGAAVAIGMVAESTLARNAGLLSDGELQRLLRVLRALRLPAAFPRIEDRKLFLAALASDKKADARGTRYSLLRRIGQTAVDVPIAESVIREYLDR